MLTYANGVDVGTKRAEMDSVNWDIVDAIEEDYLFDEIYQAINDSFLHFQYKPEVIINA